MKPLCLEGFWLFTELGSGSQESKLGVRAGLYQIYPRVITLRYKLCCQFLTHSEKILMVPIRDNNLPPISHGLIAANILAFVWSESATNRWVNQPIASGRDYVPICTAVFLHLAGICCFVDFGNNEDCWFWSGVCGFWHSGSFPRLLGFLP